MQADQIKQTCAAKKNEQYTCTNGTGNDSVRAEMLRARYPTNAILNKRACFVRLRHHGGILSRMALDITHAGIYEFQNDRNSMSAAFSQTVKITQDLCTRDMVHADEHPPMRPNIACYRVYQHCLCGRVYMCHDPQHNAGNCVWCIMQQN